MKKLVRTLALALPLVAASAAFAEDDVPRDGERREPVKDPAHQAKRNPNQSRMTEPDTFGTSHRPSTKHGDGAYDRLHGTGDTGPYGSAPVGSTPSK